MRAACASIGLHGAALVLLFAVVQQRPTPPTLDASVVRFTLVERAPSPNAALAEPMAEPMAETSPPAPPAAAVDPRGPEDRSDEVRDDRAAAADDQPTVDLQRLRGQIGALTLPAIEDEIDPFATRGSATPLGAVPWQGSGDPIRGMPLGGGWLNPWVGPVEAYSETWGSVVGEQRGVHVLPNGQVVCTRVDAPTNDELMNPWMSMRVTYVRLCGRERGTAPPADDLRYPPPPSGLRQP